MTDTVVAPEARAASRACAGVLPRVVGWAVAHPVLAASAVALAARLAFALLSFTVNHGVLIPDEAQYLGLAHTVAHGGTADSWYPGYGQTLYDSTRAFMAPLVLGTHVFGASRLFGQLFAVAWGVAVVALTVRLARELVRREWALVAGLVVALMPSQVLWSSVILRESEVWAGLVAVAVALAVAARREGARTDGAMLLLGAAGLLLLGLLRDQTMLVATWVFVAAALLLGRHRARFAAGALLVALVVPWLSGTGVGGIDLVRQQVPILGNTRTKLAIDAQTAFTPTTILNTTTTTAPVAPPVTHHPTTTSLPPQSMVHSVDGTTFLTDNGASASLSALPRGLVATTVRPFPWESTTSIAMVFAKVENVVWLALFILAAIGFVVARRSFRQLAFPTAVTLGIICVAAVTQGNLGTAFRHRGQVLWALAVLAAVAGQHIVDARAARAEQER